MTSNIGTQEIVSSRLGFDGTAEIPDFEEMKLSLLMQVKKALRPELVNRIDEVIVFRALSLDDIERIVDIQLAELNERVSHKGLTLVATRAARRWLAEKSYEPSMGARPLKKAIQQFIENPVSAKLLAGEIPWNHMVRIDVDSGTENVRFTAIPESSDIYEGKDDVALLAKS